MSSQIEANSSDSLFPSRARIFSAVERRLQTVEEYAQKNPVRFSFGSVAIAFMLIILLCQPIFETNDDVVMSMIASGTGVGHQPDEHIVFSNFLVGIALKLLYTAIPQIPWYGSYLIFVNYLANVAIVYSITTWRYRRSVGACFLLLFATVSIQLLIRLQFTSTAMWATEAGLILILTAFCRRLENRDWNSIRVLFAGGALMLIGSLVRFEAYLAGVTASFLPLLFLVWRIDRSADPSSPTSTWKLALASGAMIQFCAFGLVAANFGYYHGNAEWREFFKFNPYRVKFNDYQWTTYTEQSKWIFDQVEWTENDYDLISKYWFFDDDRVYNRAKLQAVILGYPWANAKTKFRQFGTNWKKMLRHPLLWPIWMQLPILLWFARNPRSTFLQLFIAAISIDAVICGLMLLKTPVFRMYYPLFAFQILLCLVFMRWGQPSTRPMFLGVPFGFWFWWQQRSSRWRIGFDTTLRPAFLGASIVAISVLGAGWSTGKAVHFSQKAVAAHKLLFADLERIKPQGNELYVCWGGCFPYESILPLQSYKKMKDVHLLCLGWTQKSPVNKAVKDHFQIQDLAIDLRDKPNVYLISNSILNHLYGVFVQEHHDIEFGWKPCYSSPTISVWKPFEIEPSNDESVGVNSDLPVSAWEVEVAVRLDNQVKPKAEELEEPAKIQQVSSSSDGTNAVEVAR